MFPYPSGSGLHVGHVVGYTATDIVARFKRQKGFSVLHPMGWDSFGLPAEQYAIRTGAHPAETTKKNIDTYRRQLRSLGFSYDWDREIATSDATYYKWTQWIFTLLYERGLAYEAEVNVNYCPALRTVLANEEVEDGRSKEGGFPVEKRPLRQWVLKITAYADRLLEDLKLLDWPDSLKRLQANWIGRSEGALVDFHHTDSGKVITVFTTRPDTLLGVSCVLLAPEHPLVKTITSAQQKKSVENYQAKVEAETEIERTDPNRPKSGVFTGGYLEHPLTGKPVPVWIADYVLMGYGTGAVMAVPAHDSRDFTFAQTYALPIIPLYDPEVKADADFIPKEMTLEDFRTECISGDMCWEGEGRFLDAATCGFPIGGLTQDKVFQWTLEELKRRGKGQSHVAYKLRDWLFSRQRYWGEPFPILHFTDGTKRVLAMDELPLTPPQLSDYKPSEDGQSPLAKVKEWIDIVDTKTGKVARRESNTMPQWAGSCWYYLRFCDPHNTTEAWSKKAEQYWGPVDLYVGGAEHAVLHLLYARFWHKVLFDCELVSTPEPFISLRNQGLVTSRSYRASSGLYVLPEDVEEREGGYFDKRTGERLVSQIDKMSKSKLNGVTPDQIIDQYGADALRLYEMFMGPLEKEKIWNSDAVHGCYRFLNRFYDMITSEKATDEESAEALKLGHRLLDGVTRDVEALQFNTAIAKMMEFINEFTKLPHYPKSVLKMAVQVLSPFAPHVAEELWEHLGCQENLNTTPYPTVNPAYLEDTHVTFAIQINGKLRGSCELPKGSSQEILLEAAKNHATVSRYIDGKEIHKVIFVPNKLLNLVVGG